MSSSSSMAPILLLATSLFSIISPSSSYRQLPHYHHADIKTGFHVTLKHIDSGREFTKFELLHRTTKRSRKRIENLRAKALRKGIEVPVHVGIGDYLMDLSIGTPPLPYSVALDTGSDLIWTQCKQCTECFHQPTPLYDPFNSSSFTFLPCSSPFCRALLPLSSCNRGECSYLYEYGDGSDYTGGVMGLETFTFGAVSVPKVAFGCGLLTVGSFDGSGLVGLGRGPLSLVAQLDEPRFSYCLQPLDSNRSSQLLMGSAAYSLRGKATPRGSVLTTPLIRNLQFPTFYYISLLGITIGDARLPINESTFAIKGDDGSGGMIIDSGTSITHLEKSAFDLVAEEFTEQIGLAATESSDDVLELCFALPSNAETVEVPEVIFHFDGADLNLPVDNYFTEVDRGVACLLMAASSSGFSVFGNFQQQNMLVVYDLAEESLSFVHTRCD